MPRVTVVIPVSNSAPYIAKCARSVFEQTLDDMEIIFIDDCSTDDSVDIVEDILTDYPERRKQTRFVNMTVPSGKAVVRKVGVKCATGDYLIFCNAEDWADAELYERMYDTAIGECADVVICDYVDHYTMRSVSHSFNEMKGSPRDYLKSWYRNAMNMACWNKLVKRTLYVEHDILPWNEVDTLDDNGMISRVFYYAQKMAHTYGAVYHHNRAKRVPVTRSMLDKRTKQAMGKAETLTRFFTTKPDGKDFSKTLTAFQFLAKVNLIGCKFSSLKRYRHAFPGVEKIVGELDLKAVPRGEKFRFLCVKYRLTAIFIILYKIASFRYR
jgi:glycosyltransferase involved in cell wall biosynthesis